MATYYYNQAAAGAGTGADWTNAFTTYAAALAAANTNGDVILVHYQSQEDLSGDTTFTYAANISVISVDKDNSNAPTEMGANGYIGHDAANRRVTLAGARRVYHWGMTYQVLGADLLELTATNGAYQVFEKCRLYGGNGSIATGFQDAISTAVCIDCTFRITSTAPLFGLRGNLEVYGGSIVAADSSVPTALVIATGVDPGGLDAKFEGFDASYMGLSPLVGNCTAGGLKLTMSRCKLGSSYGLLANQTHSTGAGPEVFVYDCASGNSHVHIAHANTLGSTVIDTTIYVTADAEVLSWKITTTGVASFGTPYCSPWIDRYVSDTSTAITPYFEILRAGNTTPYETDEVWGEWSYKGTSTSTQSTLVNDRMSVLGSPVAQADGMAEASWTVSGSAGNAAVDWAGKLAPNSSFTPAEVGHVRGRVEVGEPSITVYVSPRIRF